MRDRLSVAFRYTNGKRRSLAPKRRKIGAGQRNWNIYDRDCVVSIVVGGEKLREVGRSTHNNQ